MDSNQFFFMALSLIEFPLFKVVRSVEIIRSVINKHESARSHESRERVNPPIILFVEPLTISIFELRKSFGAK